MTTQKPLVSIITPSFNAKTFIEQTIRSVQAQKYEPIEHIIVDGGSTDGTVEIMRSYAGTYRMKWMSKPDHGMYDAVNKGLSIAEGELIAYLNADDMYLPWTVDTVVRFFSNRGDVDLVYGDMFNVTSADNWARVQFYPPFRLGVLKRSYFLGQPTVFWRRRVVDKLGEFDDSLKLVADCDYWMKVGEEFRVEKITEILAVERDHEEAQRFAKSTQIQIELDTVRRRYWQPRSRIHRTLYQNADRAWLSMWNRYYLLKFVLRYLTSVLNRSNHWRHGSWGNGLSAVHRIRMWYVLLCMLPFLKGRWSRWAQVRIQSKRSMSSRLSSG